MRPPSSMARFGATPARLAVVGVLATIWMVMLFLQFAADDATVARPPSKKSAPRTPIQDTGSPKTKGGLNGAPRKTESRAWPELALNEILRHNPFRRPDILSAPTQEVPKPNGRSNARDEKLRAEAERRRQFLATLVQKGVRLVLLSDQGDVARIGTQEVRVGDVVGGFRVSEISTGGVILSENNGD